MQALPLHGRGSALFLIKAAGAMCKTRNRPRTDREDAGISLPERRTQFPRGLGIFIPGGETIAILYSAGDPTSCQSAWKWL
jgi:hypothetical protein